MSNIVLQQFPLSQIQNGVIVIIKNNAPTLYKLSIPDGVYLLSYGAVLDFTVTVLVANSGFGLLYQIKDKDTLDPDDYTLIGSQDGPVTVGEVLSYTTASLVNHSIIYLQPSE